MSGINAGSSGIVVPVDALATGVWSSKTYQTFIADKVVPENPYLELQQGKIPVENSSRDNLDTKPTASMEKAPKVTGSTDFVEYKTKKYRRSYDVIPENFRIDLPKDIAKLKDQQKGVRIVTRKLKVLFEYLVSKKIFDTSVFTNVTPSTAWSDYASSTPVADILSQASVIKQKRGIKPNTVIFGQNAYNYILSNNKITTSIKNIEDQIVKDNRLLDLIRTGDSQDLQAFYVGEATTNNANPGQSESRDFIWNPNLVWVGYIQRDFISDEMLGAFAMKMQKFTDSMGNASPVEIRTIIDEEYEKGVEMIEGMIEFDLPVIDSNYGRILTIGS